MLKNIINAIKERIYQWTVCLEFKVQDCWIGCYWERYYIDSLEVLDIWVCLIPMLSIHFQGSKEF
jgi:hypothetical protein